jgi:uncharacterized protein
MVDKITREMARQVMVAAQGLDQPPPRPAGKADVLAAIRRMYLLQIDTIHVVARSPYLVLWSRLGDLDCDWLDELLAEGALFEGWAHAYCFIPIEDYPLHRRRAMDNMHRKGWPYSWPVKFLQDNPAVAEQVRAHLRENGAVRSAEFENKNKPPGGWWNWKAEKDALEAMLLTGEVMVARRHNFQRVYAPRERVLPGWDDAAAPPADEVQQALALRSVKALGVARPGWVADYFREPKKDVPGRLAALAGEGLLRRIEVEGFAGPVYVHPDNEPLLEAAAAGKLEPTLTTLLSPFDPLVWDRQRARELFDFDYTIECYTPAAKRKYGYFSLPILHRGRLVGRLDPKAHRAEGLFEVKALHLEPGVEPDDRLVSDLAAALQRLANWHGTPEVVVRQSDPAGVAAVVQAAAAAVALKG